MKTDSVELKKKIETVNDISNKSLTNKVLDSSKKNLQAIVIGGVLGLVSAIALRQKPMYGIIIGAVAGHLFIKEK